jgi:hypothetical protein
VRYVYSVVRFVPDPGRGESMNLAVLAGSDESSEWELRRVDTLKRARALDERGILPDALANIERLARDVEDYAAAVDDDRRPRVDISENWLASLASHSLNVVQFSAPLPLIADSIEVAVSMVASEFLVSSEDVPTLVEAPSLRKHAALAAARQAFRAEGLRKGQHYAERVEVVAGVHGREAFDFVVYNGKALQLVQAWSFRATAQEDLSRRVRAWAWALQGLRESGGAAIADTRNLGIDRDVSISAVCIPPVGSGPHAVWDEAVTAFQELRVTAILFDQVSTLALEAVRLLAQR